MTPYNRRLYTLAAKVESAIGTQATMSGSDAVVRVMNPRLLPVGASAIIPAGSGLSDIGSVVGAYSGALSFDMELYNNSSAWPAIMLPSCGFPLTATSGIYQFCDVISPTSPSHSWSTITAGLWYSGPNLSTIAYGTFGAMGALSLRLTAGMPIIGSFRYAGAYTQNPGTIPSGFNYESTLPPVFKSFTIDGSATPALPSLSIDGGDYTLLIAQPNTQGAVLNAWLKKPNWSLKIDPLRDATDWVADWVAGGTGHTFTAVAGSSDGNIITISGTIVQKTAPGQDDRDELLAIPLDFDILGNTLRIAFT